MVGNKFFVAALGAVAAVSLMSAGANAATSYAGTGTTALNAWIAAADAASGFHVETSTVSGISGNGLGLTPMVAPLGISSALNLKMSSGPSAMTFTNAAGTLGGTATANPTVFLSPTNGKGITISNFSPAITAFGFFLESSTGYSGNLTITLTDANGTSTITLASNGGDNISGVPLQNGTAEFIGFTGISAPSSIVLSTGTGQRYELGDFFEAVPEPASLALLGAGLVGMGLARRRKAA